MKPETYAALLKDLQKVQKSLVTSQVATVRRESELSRRFARLHAEAEVGGRVEDFVATAARKSTVLFLLRTVFVRVLEDLGILGLKRIRGEWGFAAFREVAPALDHRSYFAFVFRDLAIDFPSLFASGDDELPLPDEDSCVELWELWHHPNRDGEHYVWNGDGFDSRFLGDLYQDLDKDIRKRYALLQTPRFVEEYILDCTLTPALLEFDPAALRATNETFRLIDPTCGSGHFLIGAFHRLSDYWRDQHGLTEWDACERALGSVWGSDINPHAVDIAAFRLLLEVVARTGVKDLERLSALKLNVRAMDSLIPWERTQQQGQLFPAKDRLDHYATARLRLENARFLENGFHVVVGNPPYITPKDVRKREDYRAFWPSSAAGKFALSAPFAERFFDLSVPDGFVGQITSNSFMKREFGKKLIQTVFPRLDLTAIIDTSGAYIPGHSTPTVTIIGRARTPREPNVWALMGKKGEPRRPAMPELGHVWTAIINAKGVSDESAYVTTAWVPRESLKEHPWSLGGGYAKSLMAAVIGGADDMLENRLAREGKARLSPGWTSNIGEDDVWLRRQPSRRDRCWAGLRLLPVILGEDVRDYDSSPEHWTLYPYSEPGKLIPLGEMPIFRELWPYRHVLGNRKMFGVPMVERGLPWWQHIEHYERRIAAPRGLIFPFVATHNHFVLNEKAGSRLTKTTARVILLENDDTDSVMDVLGLLNSSVLGFWMKQVFHNKHGSGDGKGMAEEWMDRYEYDCTKIQRAPLTSRDREQRMALASALHRTAQERAKTLPGPILAASGWKPEEISSLLRDSERRYQELSHKMVAFQEELDWLTYGSYGLIEPVEVVPPDGIEPVVPGHRPFELALARDAEEEDESSAWWSLNGYEFPDEDAPRSSRFEERLRLIETDPQIALLETPVYKRRWSRIDWAKETRDAVEAWLLDRLEELFVPSSNGAGPAVLGKPRPYRLEDIVAAWSRDPRVAAVAGIWTGTGASVDLTLVAEKLLCANACPDNTHRVYSTEGIRKLLEWKRVWALQDQEDQSEANEKGERKATSYLAGEPPPPKFERADFAKADYFGSRGKLNVPRERFILFADLSPQRFGWNGWRDRDRALAQVEAYTLAEADPQQPLPAPTVDDPRRCGVTLGLWESLADVKRWGVADEHAELSSLAQEACGQTRCPCPVVEAWKAQVLDRGIEPLVSLRSAKRKQRARKDMVDGASDGQIERTASLSERAWVAGLFEPGKDTDIDGIWARHLRLVDAAASSAATGASGQLRFAGVESSVPVEVRTLNEARLVIVVDDLVASGDVAVRGRGRKKRYQLVPRSPRT